MPATCHTLLLSSARICVAWSAESTRDSMQRGTACKALLYTAGIQTGNYKQNRYSLKRELQRLKCCVKEDLILKLEISKVMTLVIFIAIVKLGNTQNGWMAFTRANVILCIRNGISQPQDAEIKHYSQSHVNWYTYCHNGIGHQSGQKIIHEEKQKLSRQGIFIELCC